MGDAKRFPTRCFANLVDGAFQLLATRWFLFCASISYAKTMFYA